MPGTSPLLPEIETQKHTAVGKIMMEQRPFLARIENPIQLESCLVKNIVFNSVSGPSAATDFVLAMFKNRGF